MTGTPAIDDRVVHVLYGETMGTRWRVDLCARRHAALDALHRRVQARLDAIVAQMSTWEAGSDLCRFNRAPAGTAFALADDFHAVMTCALAVAEASDGAFDPTLGALVGAWGFGADADPARAPGAARLRRLRAASGWRRLVLSSDPRRLLQPGDVALDLSAIAKGHAVDAVVALLRADGIAAALVDVGGELRGFGHKPDGQAWRVLVDSGDEAADEASPCVLVLDDCAVATSGTRWHAFDSDGATRSHTLDPRSGRPVADAPIAVSVVAGDAMHADAWATALTVMGQEAGLAFAGSHGLAARFATRAPDGAVAVRSTATFDEHCAP